MASRIHESIRRWRKLVKWVQPSYVDVDEYKFVFIFAGGWEDSVVIRTSGGEITMWTMMRRMREDYDLWSDYYEGSKRS